MKKTKLLQALTFCGLLFLAFTSSCSHEPIDFDPSVLQNVPFSGEEDEEEIILPDTFNIRVFPSDT